MQEGKNQFGYHSGLSRVERRVRVNIPDFSKTTQQEPSAPITETPQGTAYEDEITEKVPRQGPAHVVIPRSK